MAYNNYFPATYTPIGGYAAPYQPPVPIQQPNAAAPQTQQNSAGIVWVQGEAGAKSYLVAPNVTALLMDSEGDRFYLKSSDASGVPLPLRVFEYKEIKTDGAFARKDSGVEYATKKDLEELRKQIRELSAKEETDNE